jgi:hypothetical protein
MVPASRRAGLVRDRDPGRHGDPGGSVLARDSELEVQVKAPKRDNRLTRSRGLCLRLTPAESRVTGPCAGRLRVTVLVRLCPSTVTGPAAAARLGTSRGRVRLNRRRFTESESCQSRWSVTVTTGRPGVPPRQRHWQCGFARTRLESLTVSPVLHRSSLPRPRAEAQSAVTAGDRPAARRPGPA